MLGNRRNRQRHDATECQWGCCRGLATGDKSKTKGILRRREKNVWKKENEDG